MAAPSFMRRRFGSVLGVCVGLAIGAGGIISLTVLTGPPPGTATANVWVDANGGSCAAPASPGTYVDAAACGTLNAAVTAAAALSGSPTIRIKCGDYSGKSAQTFNWLARNAALDSRIANIVITSETDLRSCVTLPTWPNTAVTQPTMQILAAHVNLQHVAFDSSGCVQNGGTVTFTATGNSTTLQTSTDNATTSLTLASAAGAPLATAGPEDTNDKTNKHFAVKIDGEMMYVRAGGTAVGFPWTVRRAAAESGTSAASHTAGATVTYYTYVYNEPACAELMLASTTANATTGAHDNVVNDVQAATWTVAAAYNVVIQNSDFGPSWDHHGLLHCNGSTTPCTYQDHDVAITNVATHDHWETPDCEQLIPGCDPQHHQGCATTINNGFNLVFDSVHYYNCRDLPFYIHPFFGEIHDLTVKNSDIGRGSGNVFELQNDYLTNPLTNYGYWNLKFINNTWASGAVLLPSNTGNKCAGQGGSGGCEWRGNVAFNINSVGTPGTVGTGPLCGGNGGFSDGWTVEYNADLQKYCGSGTLLGSATGAATACGGTAVCDNNFKTSSFGLAADLYHLTAGSLILGQLPPGLAWLPTTDIDGDLRSAQSSPGADEGTVLQTGASLGLCSPACTTGTQPSWPSTNVVTLANVSDGSTTQTRHYFYYVPAGLVTNDPTHPPASVFWTIGGGSSNEGSTLLNTWLNAKLGPVADAGKFVVIGIMPPAIADRAAGSWLHPQTDCGNGTVGVPGSGICNMGSAPSDEGMIKASVADATSRFNLDPNRRWVIGGSSGANMARDALCDSSQTPHNSTLFRGGMTLGGGPNTKYQTTGPLSCPAADKHVFYLEITGTTSGQDPFTTIDIGGANAHTILGLNDGRAAWSTYLGGCAAAVHTTTGSQSPPTDVYDYSCSNVTQSSQFEAVSVTGGGHSWCNLDTANYQPGCGAPTSNPTGGWSTASFMWNWFATRQWGG